MESIKDSKTVKLTKDKSGIKRKRKFEIKMATKEVRKCTVYLQIYKREWTKFDIVWELMRLSLNVWKWKELKNTIREFKNWFEVVLKSEIDWKKLTDEINILTENQESMFYKCQWFLVDKWKEYQDNSIKYKKIIWDFESIDFNNKIDDEITADWIWIIKDVPKEVSKLKLREAITLIQKPKYIDYYHDDDPDWKVRFKNKKECEHFLSRLEKANSRESWLPNEYILNVTTII